ncbi:siderophore-interacting protein [Ilumatobacter coccineus]|uniref:Putative siderophore interacting protein n=1 Tax=Ilumatobacter coccineus (strain NBRC 103263 / KCTC 29153 / YM16-304) TaxID=1313172 RepID=A0A6C7EC31_ILUCY|nr:siderophore-interacting protein [Ilumatobacter coccineus]BAN04317.1 putative siderophore interacting protein [Ilumatobacter coccineus YM16-304]
MAERAGGGGYATGGRVGSGERTLPPGFVTGVGRVVAASDVGPRLRRVVVQAPEFETLDCGDGPAPGFRVLIPSSGHPVVMPTASLEAGLTYPDGVEPSTPRTITVRRHDPVAATIEIDVAMTHDGVLVDWASSAAVGGEVGFAGPRRFPPLPDGPLVLLGDESALPAIAAIIETSSRDRIPLFHVGVEVDTSADEIELGVPVAWYRRDGQTPGAALVAGVAALALPAGAVVWVAGEARMARGVRRLLEQTSPPPQHIRASGYWRANTASDELDEKILELTRELVASGDSMELLDEFALAFEERED